MSRDPEALAGEAETLLSRGLYTDPIKLDLHRGGELFAHQRDVRRELWALGNDRAVHVDDTISHVFEHLPHRVQQLHTVRSLIALVAVRKELANIAEGCRAEQGVHQRVGQHIRVRVAEQALFPGNPMSDSHSSHFCPPQSLSP